MIQIDADLCIACGACAGDCFPSALTMDAGEVHFTAESCIGCGHCIAVCPRGAVTDSSLPMDDVVTCKKEVDSEKLLTLMRLRRSCRHYLEKPVPEKLLQLVLGAARACPTAKNLQATRYIAVTEQIPLLLDAAVETLGQLGEVQKKNTANPAELRRAENFLSWRLQRKTDKKFDPLFFHAPLLLMFVSAPENARDAAAAAAYAELMAASTGLGCLYSGYFAAAAAASPRIRELLQLRGQEQVVRCLVLGYPNIAFQRSAPRKEADLTRL